MGTHSVKRLLIFSAFLFAVQEAFCTEFDVRLSMGSYGVLSVRYQNEWGTVCDDYFDQNSNGCTVVCRMLGYTSGVHAECGQGTGAIMMDNVRCQGHESSLDQCSHNGWRNHNCRHYEDSGCKCCDTTTCTGTTCERDDSIPIEVELSEESYGIVKVKNDNQWGTICDDVFDENNHGCSVICRQLGFSDGIHVECGAGTGEIWLDSVRCNGDESYLNDCTHGDWGHHDCSHSEDVGCKCCMTDLATCSSSTACEADITAPMAPQIEVSLSNDIYGILKVEHNAQEGTVCGATTVDDNICSVVCNQLHNLDGVRVDCGDSDTDPVWLNNVQCNGGESNLNECTYETWGGHTCGQNDYVGCKCCVTDLEYCASDRECAMDSPPDSVELSHGSYGRLSVFHDHAWGTVCDDFFDDNDDGCTVACNQLGYQSGISVTGCGQGNGPIWLDNVVCDGNEPNIFECFRNPWGSNDCQHTEDVGCKCCNSGLHDCQLQRTCQEDSSLSNEVEYKLLLSHGSYGIIQVNYNGEWGTVCDDVFDNNYNGCNVVCQQLGYESGEYVDYGEGTGQIWLDDVQCNGNENDLNECSHRAWGSENCVHSEDAGCRCIETESDKTRRKRSNRFLTNTKSRAARAVQLPDRYETDDGLDLEAEDCVEWKQGTLPQVILTAPHGGDLEAPGIPDRPPKGCYINGQCVWTHPCETENEDKCEANGLNDGYTQALLRRIEINFKKITGKRPSIVINKLPRIKLDPNRERDEATFGNELAGEVYDLYHKRIRELKSVVNDDSFVLILDIHGHGHHNNWAELGYGIRKQALNDGSFKGLGSASTISHLYNEVEVDFEDLITGPLSFGHFLEQECYSAVPSPNNKNPGEFKYFRGGHTVRTHSDDEKTDAIQIESSLVNRKYRWNRNRYAMAIAQAAVKFIRKNYPNGRSLLPIQPDRIHP